MSNKDKDERPTKKERNREFGKEVNNKKSAFRVPKMEPYKRGRVDFDIGDDDEDWT